MPGSVRAALLATIALLAACGREPAADDRARYEASQLAERITGDWVLVAGRVDGRAFPFPETGRGTLAVDEAYLGGMFFCNGVGGPYRLVGDRLEVGELGSTLISCSEDLMRAEAAYYRVFAAEGTRVSRSADELVLTNDVGELRFRQETPLPGGGGSGARGGADT